MTTLFLGPNEIYRSDLEFAAQRTKIDPAALASLVDAEASKDKDTGIWKPNSLSERSGAAGLTQFLADTWQGMAEKEGTYLNEVAKAQGLVAKNNKAIEEGRSQLLKLRYDPRQSVVAAAEYGVDNLASLADHGVDVASKTQDERAKLMYLAHHEGATGAVNFLTGGLTEQRAKKLLPIQIGSERAEKLIKQHGTAVKAYIIWLNDYIDRKIRPENFRRPS